MTGVQTCASDLQGGHGPGHGVVEAVPVAVHQGLLLRPGVEALHPLQAQAEEQALVDGYRDGFDYAVSRAVASLELLCELCLPYLKVGGRFLAMKGVDSGEEINHAARCISILGGRLLPSVDYVIPGANVRHRVVLVEKCTPTPNGYPRRWAKIQKAPL